MAKYIIKRVLLLIPTLLLIMVIVFSLMTIIPGSSVDMIYYRLTSTGSQVDRAEVEAMLGFDQPAVTRFFQWIGSVLRGDLGTSYFQYEKVTSLLAREIPCSLQLGLMTLILSNLISIPLGVLCAARQDSFGDYLTRVLAILMMSIPVFWLATLILIYPAKWWGYAPNVTYVSFFEHPIQNLEMFLIPAILGALSQAGMQLRTVRTVVLDVMRQDYVRTARAKGLREKVVLYRHALRNSMIPVVTMIGSGVAMMIGGSVVMENIFNIPGVGNEVVNSLTMRDFPVVMGCVLVFSIFVMIVNAIVDITYKWIDPRVSLD